MKYSLDANTCIRFLNGRVPQVRAKFLSIDETEIAICSIVKAEMFAGAMKSQFPQQSLAKQIALFNRFASLPFDDTAAVRYGELRAYLEKRGTTIGGNDMLIASITLANDLILVTHNLSEFRRVPDLKIEDWEV